MWCCEAICGRYGLQVDKKGIKEIRESSICGRKENTAQCALKNEEAQFASSVVVVDERTN